MNVFPVLLGSLVLLFEGVRCEVKEFSISAVFPVEKEGKEDERVRFFNKIVDDLNPDILTPKFWPAVEAVESPINPFVAAHKACYLVDKKAVAIFTTAEEPSLSQIRSICGWKKVVHVMSSMEEAPEAHMRSGFSLNLFPSPRSIGRAVAATIAHYRWKNVVLLYQNENSLYQLQDVVTMTSKPDGPKVRVRKLRKEKDQDPLVKELQGKMAEVTHFVIACDLALAADFLQAARKLEMTTERYQYIFTNLDLYTIDAKAYKDDGCNITGIRLVEPESDRFNKLVNMIKYDPEWIYKPQRGLKTEFVVMYDALKLLHKLLSRVHRWIKPEQLNCENYVPWSNGSAFLTNLTKMWVENGGTGRFSLDKYGHRSNYDLTVIELASQGFEELGKWRSENPEELNITKVYKVPEEETTALANKTLRVTVILEPPFVKEKENSEGLHGNDRYEGYCIDLLRQISDILKFNYTIHEVADNSYGAKNGSSEQWNGMVGELMDGKADIAVASLTISYSRSEVIDFTVPYMHLGISILFKKPKKKDPSLFTFLSPLSIDVWLYMLAAYVGVSLMLWILARFSPYEWYNPHPCDPDTDVVENQFNLLNSLWFTVGSLMQQGSDIAPRAASTRLVAGIWWLFTLVLISSYTANLAAFLTVERMVSPIENAEDLAKQTKIKYGSLGSGSTMTFFKSSKIQTYERMWNYMNSHGAQDSVFVNSSSKGIHRVKTEDYAYLMESSMLEYYVERDCELMQIGGLLDSKGYGIGLPKKSPYREAISSAILQLQEKTELTSLKEKWWKKDMCKGEDSSTGQHNELGLQNVGGVFVLLLGGIILSFIIGIIEFVYKASKNAEIDKRSIWTEMWEELQYSLKCTGSSQPRKRRQSIIGYVDEGKGTLVPSFTYGGYSAVPTKSDSYLYQT